MVISKLGHKYQALVKEAACTEPGYTIHTCSRCDDEYTDAYTPEKGHDWDDGVFDAANSRIIYTCNTAGCGETKTEPKDRIHRIYGESRYETSFGIANAMKSDMGIDPFDTVIVASGKNFPDALAGSYLAAKRKAPILMVDGENADNIAMLHSYIKENLSSGGKLYILGGTSAIPERVEIGLELYDVERLCGTDRYDTNLEILYEAGVTNEEILVCTGMNFADSLSGSATGLPMLLVNPNESDFTSAQKEFLASVNSEITIIGGTAAVNESYESALEAYDKNGTVERVAGNNRYDTSVKVAERYFADSNEAMIAYAYNFPDGLCGGPMAYVNHAPLILTGAKVPISNPEAEAAGAAVAKTYTKANGIQYGTVFGGQAVLSDNTVRIVFGIE